MKHSSWFSGILITMSNQNLTALETRILLILLQHFILFYVDMEPYHHRNLCKYNLIVRLQ